MPAPNVGALLDAIVAKDTMKVRECLASGVPAGGSKNFINTPMHYAAFYDSVLYIRMLADKGAQIDPVNDVQRTPLHTAAARGNLEAAAELVRLGADMHATDKAGMTPKEVASQSKEDGALAVVALFDALLVQEKLNKILVQAKAGLRSAADLQF